MKYYTRTLFALFLGIFIFSCSEKNDKALINQAELGWEIIDSVDFEFLGQPILADVHTAADRMIFYDFAGQEILLSDLNGKIQSRFVKTGDTPDSYGFMMNLPGFLDANHIATVGMAGVFIYDLNGNMIKKINHPESIGGAGFMAQTGKATESINLGGKDFILSKSVRNWDSFAGEAKYYESYRALELINSESGESTNIVPFAEASIFKNGQGYVTSDFEPAYEAEGDKLYISFGGEPALHVYALNETGVSLDTTIVLSIPEFEPVQGADLSSFAEGTITIRGNTPAIRNIHIQGDKILLPYYPGIDSKTMEELEILWESGDEETANDAYELAEKNLKKGVLVFDKTSLEFLGNLGLPEQAASENFASDGDFLWMPKSSSEEVEEDFLRIYKIRIVEK